jgi:antitoxin HicB
MTQTKYRMVIEWSDDDHCFVVSLPEFDKVLQPVTDGPTYEAAARQGQDALDSLIEFYAQEGWTLPEPQTLQTA